MVPDRHIVAINFRYEVITGLSLGTLTSDDVKKLKKNIFLARLMKLCILEGYKKLKFWGQSVGLHFWLCEITKRGIYKIGHISAIFKDRDFWF